MGLKSSVSPLGESAQYITHRYFHEAFRIAALCICILFRKSVRSQIRSHHMPAQINASSCNVVTSGCSGTQSSVSGKPAV